MFGYLSLGDTLQVVSGLLCALAYIPQFGKLLQHKSIEGISAQAWLLWMTANACTLVYAAQKYFAHRDGLVLVLSSALLFILASLVFSLTVYLQHKNAKALVGISKSPSQILTDNVIRV